MESANYTHMKMESANLIAIESAFIIAIESANLITKFANFITKSANYKSDLHNFFQYNKSTK